jgi:hypothetical protein
MWKNMVGARLATVDSEWQGRKDMIYVLDKEGKNIETHS